jgi:hypothetical protein
VDAGALDRVNARYRRQGAAGLLKDALLAALDACCAGWPTEPTDYWLGIDAGGATIRPWYAERPAATFKLGAD